MEKQLKNYLHTGSFGDTIYSLNAVRIMNGGNLYIPLNGMDAVTQRVFKAKDSGYHSGRYTLDDIEFMLPFLQTQTFLNSIKIHNGEPIDYDLSRHYDYWVDWSFKKGRIENWQGNNTEVYALVCGLDILKYRKELLVYPWLDPVPAIKIFNKPIIINRTPRHTARKQNGLSDFHEQWDYWIKKEYLEDMAVFVGLEKEHYEFCELHKCNIKYKPVSDMLELARLIQGCEQFIGNQSMPLSLAIGLGKTFWCEVRVDYENTKTDHGYGDVWFPRANGHYF